MTGRRTPASVPGEAERLAEEIDAGLRSRATPGRAEAEKAYLKSGLDHYGVTVPGIRAVATAVRKDNPELSRPEVLGAADALWRRPVHERRMAAVELLDLYADRLGPADLGFLERLVRESGTWALVDGLAASVVGELVGRHPELGRDLDRWAADPDFWVRRAALLALLVPLRGGGGDFERFARYADAMLEDKEFFIRKAIGWVLRDTARRRPDLVYDWLLPRAHRASGVTLREAVKPLSEAQRAAVLDARAAPPASRGRGSHRVR
ncbi:MAG TPA: DNA alkylation repair protein [Acidimicrobiales bacterium]|nr:DNA alkylation repair protein [Acidimicrobiales bacterium]